MSFTVTHKYHSVTDSMVFYAVYRCSHCLNPVIKRFKITSLEEGYAVWNKKEDLESVVKERGIKHKNRLIDYLSAPTAEKFPNDINPDMRLNYRIVGFQLPCPLCGASEPWQKPERLHFCELSSPISYFDDIGMAFEHMKEQLCQRLIAAQEIQLDPAGRSAVLREMEQIRAQIRALEDEKINGDASVCVKELQQRKTELINRRNSLGAFSKEKKSLTAEIQACEAEQPQADRRYKEELQRLEVEIAKAQQMIDEKQYLLKQYTGKAYFVEAGDNFSMALCENGVNVEMGECVSLSSLPELYSGGSVSPFIYENSELMQLVIDKLGLGEGEKANG